MKKICLIIFLLISFKISLAQIPMLDSSYVWSEYWGCYFSGPQDGTQYKSIGGDTLLNGKIYKKIFGSSDQTGYPSAFLREDSGFVFNSYEEVYYNFNLLPGDTFTFLQSSMVGPIDLIVDSVSTKFLFGQMRKAIKFKDFLDMTWIEGVGSSTGLLYDQVWYWDCNQSVICFFDGLDTYLAEGFDTCYIDNYIIGINSLPEISEIKLYPNPTKDLIIINFSTTKQKLKINVLNSLGLIVKQIENLNTTNNIEINVEDLNSGIYFLQLHFDDKTVVTKKIVVQ